MSAALAAAQAALAGMPPVQAPAQPDVLPKVGALGVLLRDAQVYTCTNGLPRISALVQQHAATHPKAPPLLVELAYPDLGCPNATHQAASTKAHQLRAGVQVVALGYGIEPAMQRGESVLRLINVIDLWAVDADGRPLTANHGDH
ncbi:hypothetical protein [Methylibium sp.]|uniref:hypothetical protein n=1 Tax=Methylibium sp. TaxID=2067992 RepID=UPI003D0B814B